MKKIICVLILSLGTLSVFAQSKVLESESMESKLLKTEVRYSVYLPDGYETSQRHYPIVYLLNGFTGDERDWIHFGNMQNIVDQGIANSDFPAMIIIMPDGDDRLYMNKEDGSYPYEDMFLKELMPYVENKYRVRKEKQFRGISGLSMGGLGTLRLALGHHDLFGACAAFSSAVFRDEEVENLPQESYDSYLGQALKKGLTGSDRITNHYRKYDPIHLVKNKETDLLNSVSIYFDCGDEDFLAGGNAQLHIELRKKEVAHEYRVRDGAHTWSFWRESLPIGLSFIGKSFSR